MTGFKDLFRKAAEASAKAQVIPWVDLH